MKPVEYAIEIHHPNSSVVWKQFEGSSPFMAVAVGDIINPGAWEGSNAPTRVLKVLGREHFFSDNGERILHGVKIFVEEVEATKELRHIKGEV